METQHISKTILSSKDPWTMLLILTSSRLISMFMKDGTIKLGKLEATRNIDSIDSMELLQISAL